MSDILTSARVKGLPNGAGLMDWGRKSRAEMIAALRRHHQYNADIAAQVLAAKDEDIEVWIVRGSVVQHRVKELVHGRD